MTQSKNGRSSCRVLIQLESEILVEATLSVPRGGPRSSIKDIPELVSRLRTDSVIAVINGKGDADLDNRCQRIRLNNLDCEVLSNCQDVSVLGASQLDRLAESRSHYCGEYGDKRVEFHTGPEDMRILQERGNGITKKSKHTIFISQLIAVTFPR